MWGRLTCLIVLLAILLMCFSTAGGSTPLPRGPADEQPADLRVTRDPLFTGEISPMQYGQFIEYLCDLVPSMWAEKLYDGSFEGLSPYRTAYLKETDFREKPWYPCAATNRAECTLDSVNPISGKVSQKIAARGGTPATVGIAQDGLAAFRDQPCVFHCYLRQMGLKEPVRVRVFREGKEYAACEFHPTDAWQKYTARLTFSEDDTNATLSITFRGGGTLWLDNASLMPEKTVCGWRPEVVQAVRALRPGVIRFGGSVLDEPGYGEFDWRDTIGDPDRRKPFRAWGGLQPTGPGLEEVVQFCREVGAEPLLCVRVAGRTPQDAADQVQYFNGTAETPMGKLRAKNGHREPYAIRYWQVGNERSGRDYEERLAAFCKAMLAVDPSLQILSSYPTVGVLRQAGAWLHFVCPHHYDCADLAGAARDLDRIRAMIKQEAPERDIRVGVTEWNTTAGHWGPRRAMLWTLDNALACSRYHNLMHRYGDLVTIANRSNLINSFCSGIIQTDRWRLYKTPTYYAQQLYATLAGTRALKLAASPSSLDVSATLSAKGDVLTLFVVNQTLNEVPVNLDLSAFGNAFFGAIWTLADTRSAGEPDVTNSFAEPERVAPLNSGQRLGPARQAYRFPALSLTVLQYRIARAVP